jgi:hypothetical protein
VRAAIWTYDLWEPRACFSCKYEPYEGFVEYEGKQETDVHVSGQNKKLNYGAPEYTALIAVRVGS